MRRQPRQVVSGAGNWSQWLPYLPGVLLLIWALARSFG